MLLAMPRRVRILALAPALVLVTSAVLAGLPPTTRAAGVTLYVDGKHGSDRSSGRTWDEALKTIQAAARKLPHDRQAAGWAIVVRGYVDYVYRERPVPGGYDRAGTAESPVVFTAEGWSPGADDYVKPIVSGAWLAPKPGRRWQADAVSGVWFTAWDRAPIGFDRSKPYSAAVFQDVTTLLWQHASLADLRSKASRGDGGYWWDSAADRLYVATWGGVGPGKVTIDVPISKGFYFSGDDGSHHVSVRGFEVRHTELGITFHLGADHSSALDNVAIGNTPFAFGTSGRRTGAGADLGTGNSFLRNVAKWNTLQGFKIDHGSKDTVICDNVVERNGLQGVKVQGSVLGPSDPRITSGTEICRNVLARQSVRRPGAGRSDEQPNGLTISNGARRSLVHDNIIRDNIVGIQMNHRGDGSPLAGTRLIRNEIHGNRSSGLSLRDGVANASDGSGSLFASHNLYWANGVGIAIAEGSTNKTFAHETVYDNASDGMQIGCGCGSGRASVTVTSSLITHNGRHGVRVASGNRATLAYLGLPANSSGGLAGSATKTRLNTRPAGYISQSPADADFLRISQSSFQFTAGPDGSPIGALY
jgi:hypothetical protein